MLGISSPTGKESSEANLSPASKSPQNRLLPALPAVRLSFLSPKLPPNRLQHPFQSMRKHLILSLMQSYSQVIHNRLITRLSTHKVNLVRISRPCYTPSKHSTRLVDNDKPRISAYTDLAKRLATV